MVKMLGIRFKNLSQHEKTWFLKSTTSFLMTVIVFIVFGQWIINLAVPYVDPIVSNIITFGVIGLIVIFLRDILDNDHGHIINIKKRR
jgi:hypothetical protein